MRNNMLRVVVFVFLVAIVPGCSAPSDAAPSEMQTTGSVPSANINATPTTDLTSVAARQRPTLITIDGEPSDWMDYPAVLNDLVGDSTGNVDITKFSLFAKTHIFIC